MKKLKYDKKFIDNEILEIFNKRGYDIKSENSETIDKQRFFSSLENSLNLPKNKIEKIEIIIDKLLATESPPNNILFEFEKIMFVSDRLSMVDELIENGKNIKFGIFGLVFYLGLTCFDSLNQKTKYKTFYEWLIGKKNEETLKLEHKLSNSPSVDIKNEITMLHEIYNREFGVKSNFFNTLDTLKSQDCLNELLSKIRLNNCLQQELDENGDNYEFKTNWLFNFRNKFTHSSLNRRWPIDKINFSLQISYETNGQIFEIMISPKEIITSLQECIIKAIVIKIDKLIEDL